MKENLLTIKRISSITNQAQMTYYLAMFTFIVLLGFMVYIGILLFAPVTPLTMKQPLAVITKQVKAGNDFIYRADYCRYIDGPAYVYRTIASTDSTNFYPIAPVTSVTKLGCDVATIHIATPKGLTPGHYVMRGVAEFRVNPLRTEKYSFVSEEFQVTQ